MSRRTATRLTSLTLAIAIGVLATSLLTRASVTPASRATLEARFADDMRHVVYAWDDRDSRSETERRQALFDFVYETFDASAWIPQSLFDSNVVTQAIVGDVDTIVGDKVGLALWRDNPQVPAFGMAPNLKELDADPEAPLRWTVNCLVCHTAEIDGVTYLGAGTKTFDELWLGEALKRLTSAEWRRFVSAGTGDEALAADGIRRVARRALHATT
jgi:hypothetical protein